MNNTFLTNDFILGNELAEKGNFCVGNISMVKNKLDDKGLTNDIIKMNNCTFVKKNSVNVPLYFKNVMSSNEFTDLTNLLPITYFMEEYRILHTDIKKLKELKFIIEELQISSKMFFRFSDEFVKICENSVMYTLSKKETMECLRTTTIDKYIQLSKNKYLTWYKVW